MRLKRQAKAYRTFWRTLRALSLIFAISAIINAQTRTPRDVVVESNRQEMDTLLLRKPILTPRDVTARMAMLKQIDEDFRELQKLNNKMMKQVTSSERVDHKSISSLLGQIGSRASRLKNTLALPEVELDKRKSVGLEVTDVTQLQGELTRLDQTIISFATNPIFQKANVVDVQLAARASADLTSIIEQSRRLKKVSSKLAARD